MATAAVLTPHDVQTVLNYFATDGNEAPYNYVEAPPEGVPRSNIKEDAHPTVIHDARGHEDTVGLDKTGFQFVHHVSEEKKFLDEEAIKSRYYKEVEDLLKKETGAKRVFIFDHTIRRNYEVDGPDVRGPVVSPKSRSLGAACWRIPSQKRVHIDQTYQASVNRVKHHLPKEADRLLKSRVRIINVWRPIENPVGKSYSGVRSELATDIFWPLL